MNTLNIVVEGQTEESFVWQILFLHLHSRGVIARPRLVLFKMSKGRSQRGGIKKYELVKKDILAWTKECPGNNVRFTTMIDLYGLPKDWPRYDEAQQLSDPYCKVLFVEEALKEDIGDWRLIPYIQLHEFEALLFSDVSKFSTYYIDSGQAVERLAAIADGVDSPELIDEGPSTSPSKRIISLIPQYKGEKPLAGVQIATSIGLDLMRAKCRHFDEWVSQLEQVSSIP